jgi:heme-degrading monooxygenase HmoA
MIIAISRFTLANNVSHEVREAFRNRPHRVDEVAGFMGMEVMSPVGNPDEICLLTRWIDEPSFYAWHKGHEYHASHQWMPKGMKLVPGSAELKLFEVFAN